MPAKLMNKNGVPDLGLAAQRLSSANEALLAAAEALRGADGVETLISLSRGLSEMSLKLRNGMLLAGMRVPLVDSVVGAQAMGRSRSPKKLAALAKAREARAAKRRLDAERKMIRKRVAPTSIGLV